MKHRFGIAALLALTLLLASGATAQAAPSLGPVTATNIQGVSAVLIGKVNPEGLATTYQFEYGTSPSFSGAAKTPVQPVGSGTNEEPARAALSGLSPSTTYYYRIVANNSAGTTVGNGGAGTAGSFQTTQGFGFLPGAEGFSAVAKADGGGPATVAGAHPYQITFKLGFNQAGEFEGQPGAVFPDGDLRDLRIEVPDGLIVNPNALPDCTQVQFHTPRLSPYSQSRSGENCPDSSQLGTVRIDTSAGERTFGIFNLEAPPGVLAQFGFAPFGSPIALDVELMAKAGGSYALIFEGENLPQSLDLHGLEMNFWGVPWGASHNGERGDCLNEAKPSFPWAKCSVGEPAQNPPAAYISLPPTCDGPLTFVATATSWQQPAVVGASSVNRDDLGQPAEMTCQTLQFDPEVVGHLDNTKASSASGFVFRLDHRQDRLTDPSYTNPAPPKTVVVRMPDGTTLNPSVGAGLGTCAPSGYAAETPLNGQGNGCPSDSKIGTLRVKTPLFDDVITGAVYLASPNDPTTTAPGAENPSDSLIAIYLVAKAPKRGFMVELAGKLIPNPSDGTLTATFYGLPQFPYTELEIAFRSGQRSFLVTPARCGYVPTGLEIVPWGNALPHTSLSYTLLKTGIGGGPCPSGTPPFEPGVSSGAVNSNVNAFTPYFVHMTREDDEQEITSFSLVLPKGVTGKLAGVAKCSDAAIAAARGNRGVDEAANPSCPAASQVGHTLSGYGVGSALTYTGGKVYLAGPYKGAPLSLVTINPATVGPFDLGTIVIQSAFQIDPRTAQLQIDSSSSDPIPHIIDGIVLHLRDIRVYIDRPEFTHNPSSCEPSRLISRLTGSGASFGDSSDDSVAGPSNHFQLLNCRILGFQPRLGIRLRGGTRRGAFPELRVTFAARGPNDSNLKDISVVIPRQQFFAQQHIRSICTRVQFAARSCPADSVYGKAVAETPLLDEPLRGNVYLRSSSGALPDLVADLYSGTVHIVLQGRIGPGRKGGIEAFFSELPDEPINRFTMTMFGGKRGLLTNSANICARPPVSNVKAIAQNNMGAVFTSKLRGQCNKKKKKKNQSRKAGKR